MSGSSGTQLFVLASFYQQLLPTPQKIGFCFFGGGIQVHVLG